MKKRYTPIIAFTIAMVLVGSIACAADKRKKTKPAVREPDEISEEALKTELLAAVEEHHEQKSDTNVSSSKKNVETMSPQENPPTSTQFR